MNKLIEKVSFDEVVDALAASQRRNLLVALLEGNLRDDSPVVVDADSDDQAFERFVSMRHVHLPKLEEYGFIGWDEVSHEVTRGPTFEEIRPLLELLDDHEDELPADWA